MNMLSLFLLGMGGLRGKDLQKLLRFCYFEPKASAKGQEGRLHFKVFDSFWFFS